MARKSRHRISYVLPLPNPAPGHRRGVNALALDHDRALLYSGGHDGLICRWSANAPERNRSNSDNGEPERLSTTCRDQVQAHTQWVNDIALTAGYTALVSASSDLTVKVWRPFAEDVTPPQSIGAHRDYVKCLATPTAHSDWIAAGGLDRKICLWDLNGAGQTLQIDVAEEHDKTEKGSVYALGVGGSIIASGGPESVVRVWDARSGKQVTKFVGHTDNVRAVLVSEHGDVVMTASSDQTIKVWSLNSGRCMHTLTMHNESVWSLYSTHPRLSVFYSADRSGLVAKTTVPANTDMEEGLCVALCQEQGAVKSLVGDETNVWTATSSSTINRWASLDETTALQMAAESRSYRPSSALDHATRRVSPRSVASGPEPASNRGQVGQKNILRLSEMASFPVAQCSSTESPLPQAVVSLRGGSTTGSDLEFEDATPLRSRPEESLEGQSGLVKHALLNDRRRVLTVDTAGEVMMWDLLRCKVIKEFGRQNFEDVLTAVNTMESVQNWCSVDTRTGRLTCVLEENYCFNAELYADQLPNPEGIEFREDQRINLGRWVLRYLFSALIDEEIRRDEVFRIRLQGTQAPVLARMQRNNAPSSIQLPSSPLTDWPSSHPNTPSATPRPLNGYHHAPLTPGMYIGAATPAPLSRPASQTQQPPLPSEDGSSPGKRSSQQSLSRPSSETHKDYFSSVPDSHQGKGSHVQEETAAPRPPEPEKEMSAKEGGSRFGKKFRIPFSTKKLGRSAPNDNNNNGKSVGGGGGDEKAEDSDEDKSADSTEPVIDDNLFGVVQKLRQSYAAHLQDQPGAMPPAQIRPSLPVETPVLKLPPSTDVIIQEDRADMGGAIDVYWGTVASVGTDADTVERVAPTWLGELLLLNHIPLKDISKLPFFLEPYENQLPAVTGEHGNSRLNANRMLRAKKILLYVAERLPVEPSQPDLRAMHPKEYLELYCQGQLIPGHMTLSALKAHVWKASGDLVLYYKAKYGP